MPSAEFRTANLKLGERTMRIMIKFALPVESGNSAIRTGKLDKVMHQIIEDLKPEAAYFYPTGGERGGFLVVEMQDSSQIADMAERFFFGLNAKVELVPVMSATDLEKGLSGVQNTIQRYG
jgi:hypothetical protein